MNLAVLWLSLNFLSMRIVLYIGLPALPKRKNSSELLSIGLLALSVHCAHVPNTYA